MTKQERIATLRKLRDNLTADDIHEYNKQIESLNWAIKELQKVTNRAKAEDYKNREMGYRF